MKKSKWLFATAVAFCATAFAATSTVTVEAEGFGKTESEALGDALARAESSVNGGATGISTSVTRTTSGVASVDKKGQLNTAQLEASTATSAQFVATGNVARYSVLSTKQLSKDRYSVKVKADILKYVAPSKTEKKDRIALLPVRTPTAVVDFYGARQAGDLAKRTAEVLERTLLRTGAFQVLDRFSLGASISELGLAGSNLSAPEEKAKLKNLHSADYIVITELQANREPARRNPVTGQALRSENDMMVELRVVIPATGEVVYSQRHALDVENHDDADQALAEFAFSAVSDLDRQLHGSTTLSAEATPAEQELPPRVTTGVKLPFDR